MMFMRATDTLKKLLGPTQDFEAASPAVTIRYARPDDALALLDLAELDSSSAPHGVVLIAEVGGRIWAAHSLDDGHAVADPFRLSGDLVPLLAARGRDLRRRHTDAFRTHPRVWPPSELDALHGEPAAG
jgi:hypothetical protein